jgi:thiol:disulfide interchange protein
MQENGIVPLVADITNSNAEAENLLRLLGNENRNLPFVAIFPAENPTQPILLQGIITQRQFLDALRRAGPSQTAPGTATAMRPAKASEPASGGR